MKTPDYVTIEDYNITTSYGDKKMLMAGSFARPIEFRWLPKHIVDSKQMSWYDKDRDVYCYCHYGITILPFKLLRRV